MIAQLIRRGQLCILEYVGGDPYLFGCTHSHRAKSVFRAGSCGIYVAKPFSSAVSLSFVYMRCFSCA